MDPLTIRRTEEAAASMETDASSSVDTSLKAE
jgi:hypothetical protein